MYRPTGEIIAEFFTKPLQGAQFYKFHDAILGSNVDNDDEVEEVWLC